MEAEFSVTETARDTICPLLPSFSPRSLRPTLSSSARSRGHGNERRPIRGQIRGGPAHRRPVLPETASTTGTPPQPGERAPRRAPPRGSRPAGVPDPPPPPPRYGEETSRLGSRPWKRPDGERAARRKRQGRFSEKGTPRLICLGEQRTA